MLGGKCWNCGTTLEGHEYGRETTCLKCANPTRVCRNCRWFSPGRPNDCLEPVAEPVQDKVRANYCEFFEPTAEVGERTGQDQDDLRKAAEDLFNF